MEQKKLISEVFEPRLTIKEASIYLDMSVDKIYRLIEREKLKAFKSQGVTFISFTNVAKFHGENICAK